MEPKDYNKEIKVSKDKNGYYIFFDSKHPLSYDDSKVIYHRHIASLKLGRWILSEEHVHHIDGNKLNNHFDNLEVLTRSEHTHLHNPKTKSIYICQTCGKKFYPPSGKIPKYCSQQCIIKKKKFDISAEELHNLVWSKSLVKVGKELGVSDVAIKKRCKKLGIQTPPRGYWN